MGAAAAAAVIAALNAALNAALAQAEVRRGLLALGAVPVGGSPAELDAFVQAELAKWAAVVRQSGMRLD